MKITFLILIVLGCCSCGREKPAPVKHIAGKKKPQLCQIVDAQSGYREIECEQDRYWIDSQ